MPPAAPNTLICMVSFYSEKTIVFPSTPQSEHLQDACQQAGHMTAYLDRHQTHPLFSERCLAPRKIHHLPQLSSPFLTRYKLRRLHAPQKQPLKPQIVHGSIKPFPKIPGKGASSEIPDPAAFFRMGTDLQEQRPGPCRHPSLPCKTGVYDAECARSPFTRLLLRDGTPPDALPAGAARELPAGTVQRHAGSVCGTRSHREDAADWAAPPECG